jgi:protocatechuate 3,4-dioxygenase, beta subunit
MVEPGRRNFIQCGVAAIVAGMSGIARAAGLLASTPSETEGPFYPVVAQKDMDFDLTRVEGGDGLAQGKIISPSRATGR